MMDRIRSFALTFGGSRAVDGDAHGLRFLLDQRLRRQHMLDLGGADAEGERAERAMRRGVAVAAHQRDARQGEALLRADDVADALAPVALAVIFEPEQRGVLREVGDLRGALGIRARRGPMSPRYGRRPAARAPARGPSGRRCAAPRRPAGCPPRGRSGGRYKGDRCRPAGRRPHGRPRPCRRGCGVSTANPPSAAAAW